MRLLLAISLTCFVGCVAQPPTDRRAADCVAMTFAYRNITRDAQGPIRVTLDDRADDYRDLDVYEAAPDGPRRLGRFRVWNNRRMEFTPPDEELWEPVGWCD